ncbi:uncharacterized protein K452DRAFT_327651 [Aplosporella prunicola CBS 121167]|uniref:Mis12 domain-containing protein n=1 Tax=Aplosporella prunicola CBS 121167 TaxID=1176127 RepID=A0A6A6B839_9PEZI|nr:uncharacterized protein K452DRAFT_327651 [Aplosporella prunicola CBS 121167]KAF2140260.1 hypothetical protein K452DRAFT_327651 [Aplosporella prunicola CBS 121167]
MASTKQIETSLLTEHFRYTPLSLIDHIINAINELISHAVDAVERGLNDAPPSILGFVARAEAENTIPDTDGDGNLLFPEMRAEIEEGVHQLETLLESTVDKNFDKLEIYLLRNVLTVPEDLVPWVKLAHYENLELSQPTTASAKPTPTPESVQALRRKVHETNKLHTALLTEKARNDALLTHLRSLLGSGPQPKAEPASSPAPDDASAQHQPSFAFLANTPAAQTLGISLQAQSGSNPAATAAAAAATPIQTNTAFTLSQLPALRRLLESLRPKIAALSAAAAASSEGAEGAEVPENASARARRDYVETQTRRLLEKRGVDVRSGEGGDGEGLGRRVGQDEIRGMEAVAELLGKPAEERVERAAEADRMDVS